MPPAQSGELGPAHTGHHDEPHERAPIRVLRPGRFDDRAASGALGGSGWGGLRRGFFAASAELVVIQPRRIVAPGGALTIQWTCKTEVRATSTAAGMLPNRCHRCPLRGTSLGGLLGAS